MQVYGIEIFIQCRQRQARTAAVADDLHMAEAVYDIIADGKHTYTMQADRHDADVPGHPGAVNRTECIMLSGLS